MCHPVACCQVPVAKCLAAKMPVAKFPVAKCLCHQELLWSHKNQTDEFFENFFFLILHLIFLFWFVWKVICELPKVKHDALEVHPILSCCEKQVRLCGVAGLCQTHVSPWGRACPANVVCAYCLWNEDASRNLCFFKQPQHSLFYKLDLPFFFPRLFSVLPRHVWVFWVFDI